MKKLITAIFCIAMFSFVSVGCSKDDDDKDGKDGIQLG